MSYQDAFRSRRGPPATDPREDVVALLELHAASNRMLAAGAGEPEWAAYYTERARLMDAAIAAAKGA